MKKIIVFVLLLFIALFSYTSKKQPKKQRDTPKKYNANENQLLINRNNHSLKKFDEPMQSPIGIYNKQPPVKHFARHRKGKLSI